MLSKLVASLSQNTHFNSAEAHNDGHGSVRISALLYWRHYESFPKLDFQSHTDHILSIARKAYV